MRHVDNERIREDPEFGPFRFEFHDMRYFVPTKAYESVIVLVNISLGYDVRFVIRLPRYLKIIWVILEKKSFVSHFIRFSCIPPFRIISSSVSSRPHMETKRE